VIGGKGPVVGARKKYTVIDNGEFVMHNIVVGADSGFNPLLHQETGLAVFVINLVLIQIDSYLDTSLAGFCKREGDFSIGKYIHGNIDEGLGLIDIFNDFFLGIVREREVDFGFGQGGKGYSYTKDEDEKYKNSIFSISF